MDGSSLPRLVTPIPGPASERLVSRLAVSECPAITARRARRAGETGVPQDPIVWEGAVGANVRDVDGNVFVDLTGGFGVAGPGHSHPAVVAAAHRQADALLHAMGDVYPSAAKIELCDRLVSICPPGLDQVILGLSGADAVSVALKTASLHTGKPGAIAFWGSYHGLEMGALAATGYREGFRAPFVGQFNPHIRHFPFPYSFRPPPGLGSPGRDIGQAVLDLLEATLANPASGTEAVGAIIVEPILGRGGEVVPPDGFLAGIRELCDHHGLVLIVDEIYTGMARTGAMFACEHDAVVPDLLCVGKALGGGAPLSAVVGRKDIMASWGESAGEAIHTSTFLGNPLTCAMGLALIDVLESEDWASRNASKGAEILARAHALARRHPDAIGEARGRGMMVGLELVTDAASSAPDPKRALELMDGLRRDGFLVLPSGSWGNVLALTPPYCITDAQLDAFFDALDARLA